tara:strand:+ start:2384 stop:2635 length:252 start_codon:yes stop_codon:yes gene_type:complete
MLTKYKHWGTRELADTHWKWIVTAEVEDSPKEKRKFLQWMTEEFGEQGSRWSVRWSMLGVDIRFHEPRDYFRFSMFHCIDPDK